MKSTVVILAWLLGGCATLVEGSSQQLSINSNVAGAEVVLGDNVLGKTPLTIEVSKGDLDQVLIVRKQGYAEQHFNLKGSVVGAFWGNILLGGTTGSTTDAATGAMYEYAPTNFFAELAPAGKENPWRSDARLRHFVLMSYAQLVEEITQASGPNLTALFDLMMVEEKDQARVRRGLQASLARGVDPIRFLNDVVALAPAGRRM